MLNQKQVHELTSILATKTSIAYLEENNPNRILNQLDVKNLIDDSSFNNPAGYNYKGLYNNSTLLEDISPAIIGDYWINENNNDILLCINSNSILTDQDIRIFKSKLFQNYVLFDITTDYNNTSNTTFFSSEFIKNYLDLLSANKKENYTEVIETVIPTNTMANNIFTYTLQNIPLDYMNVYINGLQLNSTQFTIVDDLLKIKVNYNLDNEDIILIKYST